MLDTSPFKGWPSRDCRPVLKLIFEPKELEKKYHLRFVKDKDDLDWFEASHFYDSEIGPIVMIRHENSPQSGTPIYIDAALNIEIAINRIIEVLNLDASVISWNVLSDK